MKWLPAAKADTLAATGGLVASLQMADGDSDILAAPSTTRGPMAHDPAKLHPESLMMSHGYDPFLSEGAAKPPIFMTSTFVFRKAEEGEKYFRWAYGLEERRRDQAMGLIYTRLNNPSLQILEERLAVWDGAEAALSFASGMAAISTAALATLAPGDVLLYSQPVYGGTEFLFEQILPRFGITTKAFPLNLPAADLERLAREYGDRLAVFFLETPANPTNELIDIAAVAGLARRLSELPRARPVRTWVDNTFLGPVFQNPASLGADLVLYSATKFIGGHSDVIAGAVTGPAALIAPISIYRGMLGAVPDPFTCWLLLRSLETVKVRMEAQAKTAEQLARMLANHPRVERVYYPAILPEGTPQRALYERQCKGPGAIISFEVKGGKAEAFAFLNAVELCKLAVSLGGTESLVEHPATMTHSDVPIEVQARVGITDRMIRLSVGLENPDDLIADLSRALDATTGSYPPAEVVAGVGQRPRAKP